MQNLNKSLQAKYPNPLVILSVAKYPKNQNRDISLNAQ